MEIYNIAIIPLILGIVELAKGLGMPVKFAPLLSVLLGLTTGIFFVPGETAEGIAVGLMLGLSASGLYSGAKTATEGLTKE